MGRAHVSVYSRRHAVELNKPNEVFPQRSRPVIRMAFRIRELLLNSICRHPPEHYAVLAGYLNDPHRVTDCRPMPPMLDCAGRANRGATHVQLNAAFIEYYLNMELLPVGKYVLGVIHTQPGSPNLSGGVPASRQGDVPSMRAALERAAVLRKNWKDFLAPVVTGAETGQPTFTGWIVRLDYEDPVAADIIFEDSLNPEPRLPIEEWMSPYQALIRRVRADRWSSAGHKRWVIAAINKCMRAELQKKINRTRSAH